MRKFVIFFVLCSLILISCGGDDIFAGKAYRLRAEQGLKEIRNALVAYRISSGQYPDEKHWQEELLPYFRKERSPDPQWVTKRKMRVMSAKNNISQVKGILRELKRKIYYADTTLQANIMEFLGPIDSALTLAEYEVTEARRYDYRDINPELKGFYEFTSNLNLPLEKRKIVERMENQYTQLNDEINELEIKMTGEDTTFNKAVENVAKVMKDLIKKSLLEVQGKSVPSAESLTVHSDVIENLTLRLNPKKDSLLMKDLKKLDERITNYTRGKDNIEFLGYLNELKKKLPASINLFNNYYNKDREIAMEANKVLNGYAALVNLRSLVHFFVGQNDSLPKGNLFVIFKDDEDMKELRKDLSSDPYLCAEDNGYRLEAKALDNAQTPLVLKVAFINTYEDIVRESFSSGPFYSTNDSNTTFFVMVNAKDKEHTIITIIPKFKEEERR